ncbi:hypothetical protein [Singulisphaera acidiphila]|uniref:Uncharacterized protein n=1 Tax=Singulisphaera acidiphila (strain ATCC BAA-1392 / DSM 18658 / VKM B-2454 / MOB10) TaxID=886293 RepID=L0DBH4_SINAD|nr:hypothetical protein [Singulisphaera acidiphila]AGA26729.1 hypothetical protein Sinac_2418 [Singulisphaera acidiphila DSM 18658]
MTTTTLQPGRRRYGLVDTRRISKPRLSQLILVFTGMVIALVLFVWLLFWINPTRRGIGGRWIAQRGLTHPLLGFQAADIEKITGAVRGTVPESDYGSFRDVLRDHLTKAANRPVVLYVSAAGVVDDKGAVLLRDDGGVIGETSEPDARHSAISLEQFFEVFKDAGTRFPSQSRFLIWDAGQIGSDRNLGVYANGFLPKLRSYLAENPVKRLVILSSCAPGQTSTSSEFDNRSVFGYFVEQGLAGKGSTPNGLSVQSLTRYVRAQVALWARNHRQAEQTPELFGDTTLDFPLPRSRKVTLATRPEGDEEQEETKRFLKRLERAWAERDGWQKRKPYRSAPRTWLRYQETLLRAERLFRAGESTEAESALNSLPNLASEVTRVPAFDGSLALLEKNAATASDKSKQKTLEDARSSIDEALDLILGGDETAAPGEEADGAEKTTEPAVEKEKGEAKKAGEPGPVPPAKQEVSAKQASVVPTRKKTQSGHATLSGRRKADSPIARLSSVDDDRRPLFPEAQLIVWADTFVTRGPDRNAFRGRRGEALEKAIQTRNLAEVAAASDERINRWIRPWVEAGDVHRRNGQDLLFAAEPAVPRCLEALDQADEAYQIAIKNAEICDQAIDQIEQLSAELPYYGEWKARRGGRLEIGLDPSFQELLDSAAELARLIHSVPPPLRTEGDPLAGRDEQIQRIKRQYGTVAESFRGLTDDFHNQWEGGRWRDLDTVLNVPLIPAEIRMKLLERVRSRPIASSLLETTTDASSGSSTSSGDSESRLKKESDSFLAERAARSSPSSDPALSETESPADPSFWRTASGLARLELGLLEIGGAKKEEVASLRETYDRACRKLGGSPFSEFAEFSERIRSLRRARLLALGEKPNPDLLYEQLDAADRALRVLPLADEVGRDKLVEQRIKFLRRDLSTWHGQRLLDDFAPRQALATLEKAGDDYGDSNELRRAVERAKVMLRANLLVDANAPKTPTLDDQEGMTVSIKVHAEGEIPAGDAVAFLGHDLRLPVSVNQKGADASSGAAGTLVPIGAGNPADPAEFVVERTDSTPETVTIKLEPGAFYRGQIFPRDLSASAIVFRLTPGKEGIDVTLRQSDRRLIKIYGDQFERHPGQGFLHPHTPLAYRFVINHTLTKPAKIWVRYGLEGKDETFVTRKDVKLEPGRPNDEIGDRVDTDLHEIPFDKARYLVLEIRKDTEMGRVLFKRRYPFRQVAPSQYMRVQDGFDEVQNMAYVNVWHLKSDPVSGPSDVTVSLDGQSIATTLDRGGAEQWWRIYPKPPLPVFWRIQVEKVIDAFKGRIDTGVVPPEKTAPAQ